MKRSLVVLTIACVLCCLSAAQTVPQVIRFSGTTNGLHHQNSGVAGAVFAVYADREGGAALWQESQNVSIDLQGRYTAMLGSATKDGIPSSVFASGEARWLGVAINGSPEESRIQLVSVPYAMKANDSDTLNGLTADDIAARAAQIAAGGNITSAGSVTNPGANTSNGTGVTQAAITGAAATDYSGTTTDHIVSVTQLGTGTALKASTGSATNNTIQGVNTSTTGSVRGVYGEANSTATSSAGVYGISKATTGVTYGVLGITNSVQGTALNGTATSLTGGTIGLRGQSNSNSGTGVQGASTSATGNTTGVNGFVLSPAGTAGLFDNRAGGKILSLRNNAVEKLFVDGSGNVTTLGSFTGSGAGLTSLNASSLATGFVPDAVFGGTYTNQLQFNNVSNLYYGEGVIASLPIDLCNASSFHVGLAPAPAPPYCATLSLDSTNTSAAALTAVSTGMGIMAAATGATGYGLYVTAEGTSNPLGAIGAVSKSVTGTTETLTNTAGGKILSMNNGVGEVASVDGIGSITTGGALLNNTVPMMAVTGASFANAVSNGSGSGTLVTNDGFLEINTGTTASSFIVVQNQNNFLAARGLDRTGAYLTARTRWRSGTIDATKEYRVLAGDSGNGFGFHAIGTEIFGECNQGAAHTSVDLQTITVGGTPTDFYDLLAVHRAGHIDFYVNGLLEGTCTTNIAAGAAFSSYYAWASNNASTTNAEYEVTMVTVGIPMD